MIENLNEKLSGSLPVTIDELIELVSSHGRKDSFITFDDINFGVCSPNKCYPLENLDVSQIEHLSFVFRDSMFNGDLSKWDISNCTNIKGIFSYSDFNNDSLKDWNVSKVENMEYVFFRSIFNGDLSGWNLKNVNLKSMFEDSKFNNNSISNWNTSNCINMRNLFYGSIFNCNINNWDVSNVLDMSHIFSSAKFDGDISSWKFNKNINCDCSFSRNKNFINKYNNGNQILIDTKEFLIWFEENREKIKEINTPKEEVLDFFSFNKNIKNDLSNS